jgi:hypothetical protein
VTSEEDNVATAWQVAAGDLGLAISSPYVLQSPSSEYAFIALVENFGCERGTLICLPHQWDDLGFADRAEDAGFYCSGLYPESYAHYDRDLFIETLRDWGWFGDADARPEWYEET